MERAVWALAQSAGEPRDQVVIELRQRDPCPAVEFGRLDVISTTLASIFDRAIDRLHSEQSEALGKYEKGPLPKWEAGLCFTAGKR